MLASVLESTGVAQIQSSHTLVQAFVTLHALACPANDDPLENPGRQSVCALLMPRTENSVCASGCDQ